MNELNKLYFKLPKESFELLLRNVVVREELFKAWKCYLNADLEKVEETVDKIFNEIFRVFFRQLEIFGIKDLEENPFDEFLKSYIDFTTSILKIWGSFFEVEERNIIEEFLNQWMELSEKFNEVLAFALKQEALKQLPFLSKDAVVAVYKAIESYEKLKKNWKEYRELLFNAWKESNTKFMYELERIKTPEKMSFSDFVNIWTKNLSHVFDLVVKDERFVKVQSELLNALMDFLKYKRIFNEVLAAYPSNPFALKSEIDEAYKRIHDLKREIRSLNERVEKLEQKIKEVKK